MVGSEDLKVRAINILENWSQEEAEKLIRVIASLESSDMVVLSV